MYIRISVQKEDCPGVEIGEYSLSGCRTSIPMYQQSAPNIWQLRLYTTGNGQPAKPWGLKSPISRLQVTFYFLFVSSPPCPSWQPAG